MTETVLTESDLVVSRCPRCMATRNNNWEQCGGECPMPASPHYKMGCHASQRILPDRTVHKATNRIVQGQALAPVDYITYDDVWSWYGAPEQLMDRRARKYEEARLFYSPIVAMIDTASIDEDVMRTLLREEEVQREAYKWLDVSQVPRLGDHSFYIKHRPVTGHLTKPKTKRLLKGSKQARKAARRRK